jgi:hypothetical protein
MRNDDVYLGNPNLKRANVPIDWDEESIAEFIKCQDDPVYFAKHYVKIVSLDEGLIPFSMYDFQEDLIRNFHTNRFNIAKLPRQTGKTTTVVSYLLHYAIFNPNINIAILANKSSIAMDILGRLQLAYENLPKFLQQGVISWNKGSMVLENGSKISANSTSSSAVRGMSFNIIFLDEFAFIPNHIAEQFFSSVYPTISSGTKTKVIIISTPNGMNMFYKLWHDAQRQKNDYIPLEVHWSQVPGRDDKWKEQTIANTSARQFTQEFECEFLGSVDTLISPAKLRTIVIDDPIISNAGLDIYERPVENHDYLLTVDVARGVSNDYSAFIIYDITTVPYKIVGKYRSNEIKPMLFPNVIETTAQNYNKAYVLIEVNDIGAQVADIMQFDLEYPNLLMCAMKGRAGQVLGTGFSHKAYLGVKTTTAVKKTGCSNLKTLIEDDKLILCDYEILSEMTTFIQKNKSFEAEDGCNDDLVMCMVIFAWMIAQPYFKEMTSNDVRQRIYEEQKNAIEQDMSPFGFILDGLTDEETTFTDETGDRWHLDEFGDKSFMWEYH